MQLTDCHLFDYDISHVPPGQRAMFNFRAIFNRAPEQTEALLDVAGAIPLPGWRLLTERSNPCYRPWCLGKPRHSSRAGLSSCH